MSGSDTGKVPRWVDTLIVVCMLPAFSFPYLLSLIPPGAAEGTVTMLWIYPFYVLVAGLLARMCWTTRSYMTWILLILMLLTHACAWALVFKP